MSLPPAESSDAAMSRPGPPVPTIPATSVTPPAPGSPAPAGMVAMPVDGGIATLPPPDETPRDRSPLSPRTGEPRRPILIWVAAGLGLAATAIVAVALALVMWNSIPAFAEASWINARMQTDPGSWVRVAFSIINAVVAAGVGGATAFVGYHAFSGADWTRWGAIAAAAVSLLSLMLTPLAAASIAPAALAALVVWLPPCRRYFNAWTAFREWKVTRVALPERIAYGPLPRYR
ncbi:hypothetical protein [Propionicicella superfundia]|uniref:hypothetical protein n=1 Tax=Propionicicella superfundia TaxID=348582 RepID=UPI000413ACF2|nr:hypothetical protein [Propionicicella superfundia]